MIQTVGLTKYYKKRSRGILDVNLDIRKGEIFGFIGPNGAGKSTTVRTLLNLIFPTEGSASVNGLDVVRDTVEIRKHIGYIPSEVNYYGDMTVQDFLVYAASFYGEKKPDAMHTLAKRLELDLTRKIENLSYGNKRKVAIVQALQHDPDILILDEPTAFSMSRRPVSTRSCKIRFSIFWKKRRTKVKPSSSVRTSSVKFNASAIASASSKKDG